MTLVFPGDPVHPVLHGGVFLLQQSLVPIVKVQLPGNDAGCIPPGGDAVQLVLAHRHHAGNTAVQQLLLAAEILHEFAEEACCILMIAGRVAEDLNIPCPTHALVPLGAVGGNVQEVALQAPLAVKIQPVQQGIAGLQRAGFLNVGIHGAAHEFAGIQFAYPAFHLHVAEAKVGKVGLHKPERTIGDIAENALGGAQIVPVNGAVQHMFPVQQADFRALGGIAPEAAPAGKVLPHIQHGVIRCQHRGGEVLMHQNLRVASGLQGNGRGRCQQGSFRLSGRLIGILGFAVVDALRQHRAACDLPAFIRADDLFPTVGILQVKLCQQFILRAVVGGGTLQTVVAHVPAFAQHHIKHVVPGLRLKLQGLIHDTAVIGMEAGAQYFFADDLAVQAGFKQSQTYDVAPCPHRLFGHMEGLAEYRTNLPSEGGRDPCCPPGLILSLGGLEPAPFTGDLLLSIGQYRDPPVIPGSRRKLHRQRPAGTVHALQQFRALPAADQHAGIVHRCAVRGKGNLHTGGSLLLSLAFFHTPAKQRLVKVKAQRMRFVTSFHACDFHARFPPSAVSVPGDGCETTPAWRTDPQESGGCPHACTHEWDDCRGNPARSSHRAEHEAH